MKLYAVRHSITHGNILGHINGQLDDPLTDEGRKDIQKLVDALHGKQLDVIYASPLTRTMQTAEPIARDHELTITPDRRLIEVGMGSFEGKSYSSTLELLGHDSPSLLSTYAYDLTPYGGESAAQVERRVRSLISELKEQDYASVLLVTHGGTMRMIHYVCTGEKIGSTRNLEVREYTI